MSMMPSKTVAKVCLVLGVAILYNAVAQTNTNYNTCRGWTNADTEAFVNSLMAGVICGIIIAIVVCVVQGIFMCCPGVCQACFKPNSSCDVRKASQIAAGICIAVAVVAMLCPFFGSMGACAPIVDKVCSGCTCSDQDKQGLNESCAALGILVAYLLAFGFIAVVLGIVGAAMSCCVLCNCCKTKMDAACGKVGAPVAVA